MTPTQAIQRACDLVGGQSALARKLVEREERLAAEQRREPRTLTPQAIQYWCRKRVPAEWVIDVEAVVEAQFTRYDMRPDLYPRTTLATG